MALSSHRKLNVEQLINLAQVYWDDPGKLMEIVEATDSRMDPAAQLLFGAVTNRLNRLRTEPMKALGETPPDLAALIAARLGTQPPAAVEGEELPAAETEPVPAEAAERRRRWSWAAVLAALLLASAAAWWLWPQADEAQMASGKREIGVEIQEGGLVAGEEAEKTGTASAPPPGRRRPEFPQLRERDNLARELEDSEAGAIKARVGLPGTPAVKELDEVGEARDVASSAGGRAVAGGGSGGAAAGAGGRDTTSSTRIAARSASGSGARSSAGIAIEEALLQCYLTDNRPTACAPAGSGGVSGGRSGSVGAGGAALSGGGSSATLGREAPPGGPGSRGAAARAPAAGSAERAERSSAAGRGAGSGSGGSSAGSASAEGSASTGQRPSASASAGGGADSAPAKKSPPQRTQLAAVPPDPDCPEEPQQGRVVFIFDGSISMGLPLGMDPAEEDRLDEGVRRRDPEARREYRALLQQSGPKRMGRAQAAFADAAAELPEHVELGLVVFQECRDIRPVGLFDGAARGRAIDYVQNLIPRGRTPLADSLVAAAEMLGDGPSSIVLLTDGIEFCSGDPCAAAAQLRATRPGAPIHIIDVTGQRRTECVAQITGGRSYAPAETEDLARVLRNAFRGAAPRCGAPG